MPKPIVASFAFKYSSFVIQNLYSCRIRVNEPRSEYLHKCNLGKTINLPYKAPSCNGNNVVEFRYSIVFSLNDFLENLRVQFPICPSVSASSYLCNTGGN